ncbi:MAG: protoporphyrinogen/coproporphyrinogen oxidase [Polyangiales bacterium]
MGYSVVIVAGLVIIGGGLAGLTAAFRLASRVPVTLLEAAPRLGGQILTELADGFVIERGAEGFVFRSQAVPAVARDLGMPETELIGQSVMRSYGFDGERLVALQPGEAASFLGFQVSKEDLGKGIRSLRRGMGSLVSAFEGNLRERVSLRLSARASDLQRHANGVRVQLASGASLDADAVIVATGAATAARLLQPLLGTETAALASAPTLSSVTVELAYPREAIEHPLDATGFVVAEAAQQDGLRACTFTSSKFADRAPPGKISLRLFMRPNAEDIMNLDDAAFVERAERGLARALSVRGRPLRAWVSRWKDALPVFTDAHRAQVAVIEQALAGLPIALAGSAFHGAGIDAAVRSGEAAAATLPERAPSLKLSK